MTQLREPAAGLTVREIDPRDARQLEAFLDITEEYFRESWPEDLARPNWRDRYRELLLSRVKADPRRWLWLITHENQVIGMANFYVTGAEGDRIGNIAEVYVRPQWRSRRFGSRIFGLAKDAMRAAGTTRVKATVQMDEPGRVKFWENLGFRIERLNMVLDLDA